MPVVRVPWLEPGILMKALDAGAYGVICPMVNTREDAQRLVAYTHYAPRGTRSFGPVRALLYGGADYPQHANDTIVTFAMIETAQALDNLDDILSVEGLDAVYIGPSDLSLALGCRPVFDDVDPPVAQAIDHILERAKAHGLVAGIHNGTPEGALARIAKGFQFVTVSSDARLMAAGAQQVLAKMRATPAPARRPFLLHLLKGHRHEDRIHRPRHHGRADGAATCCTPATRCSCARAARCPRRCRRPPRARPTPTSRARADVVVLMLPDTPDVEPVLFGEDGVAEGLAGRQDW